MAAVMDSMHPSFDEEEQLLEQRLDVDLDEEPGNFPTHDLVLSPGVSPECLEQWKNKSLDDKCREVMEHLEDGRRRWSEDDEPSNVPILEDFKKSLLLKPDLREDNTPTILHVLARRWRSYKLGIPAVRKAVMFLIENAEDTIEPGFSGHPVWKAAMNIGGIEFLDFLKDNFRSKLPDIMAVQDKDGRNFIHAIFYIVQDKSYPHLGLDARRTFTFDYPSRPIPENNVGTRFVPEATAQILAMQDNDGNTPIHYAMYRIQALGRSDRYIDMVKSMVETAEPCLGRGNDFNRLDQSPIQYCLWTFKQRRNRPNNSSTVRSDSKDGRNTVRPVPGIKEAPKPNQPPRSEPRPGNPTQERDSSLGVPPTNAPKKNNLVPESPDAPAGYGFSRSSTNPSLQPPKPDGPVVPQIKEPQGKGLVPVAPERKPSRSASMAAPRPSGGGQIASQEKAREAPKPSTTGTQKPSAGDQQKDPMASVEKLMQVLKRHYVRERREIFARELVYGKNTNEKNLFFDAGFENQSASNAVDLVHRLSVGGFCPILSYVYLPSITAGAQRDKVAEPAGKTYAMNRGAARSHRPAENPRPGRRSVIDVFDMLYNAGVREILRLHVDDMVHPSHMDAAIERAIGGRDAFGLEEPRSGDPFAIEEWDWRKSDLSIDSIYQAARFVQYLHLYWSGNQAVLRGWASLQGIPRLCSPANKSVLRVVHLHATPGLESRERMERLIKQFKESLDNNIDSSLNVEVKLDIRINGFSPKPVSGDDASGAGANSAESENPQPWLERMDDFRAALQRVHQDLPDQGKGVDRVRVALIDDGTAVDSLPTYYGQIVQASGISYCSKTGQAETPWHRSSQGHGTVMANMITRVNPWVSLCVMRVQDGAAGDGSRTIFADSAASAIWGAIGRKVNIISMSWTIQAKIKSELARDSDMRPKNNADINNERAIENLEKAVKAAADAKILMFCSASDDIQSDAMSSLPYKAAPASIFRIGAADRNGQRDPTSEDTQRIDWFMPGNRVAEAVNPKSNSQIRWHTGSSVSTALAAGLASLIIYCTHILRAHYEHTSQVPQATEAARMAEALQIPTDLRRAFDSIDSPNWSDKKFLPVWETFRHATADLNRPTGDHSRIEVLRKLVMKFCANISY